VIVNNPDHCGKPNTNSFGLQCPMFVFDLFLLETSPSVCVFAYFFSVCVICVFKTIKSSIIVFDQNRTEVITMKSVATFAFAVRAEFDPSCPASKAPCYEQCQSAWSGFIHHDSGSSILRNLADRNYLAMVTDSTVDALTDRCCGNLTSSTKFCKIVDYAIEGDERAVSFFEQNLYGHLVKPKPKFPDICDVSANEFANCYIPLINPDCPYHDFQCANAAWQSFDMGQKFCRGDMSVPKPIIDQHNRPKPTADAAAALERELTDESTKTETVTFAGAKTPVKTKSKITKEKKVKPQTTKSSAETKEISKKKQYDDDFVLPSFTSEKSIEETEAAAEAKPVEPEAKGFGARIMSFFR